MSDFAAAVESLYDELLRHDRIINYLIVRTRREKGRLRHKLRCVRAHLKLALLVERPSPTGDT